ncbi:MAG: sensor histidine kinase, partial [Alphaproteobacteria bacterium]
RRQKGSMDLDYAEGKLALIEQQSEKMGNIINHLRMFSRIDKERMERFDLEPVISRSIELVREQFDVDDIQIDAKLPGRPLIVRGHPNQLEHVLLNLLNNARDAIRTRRKQVSDMAKAGKVDVEVATGNSGAPVTIRVTDNGMGIPSKDLGQIFDPFFTTKAVGEGTGLGLSISQGIIDAMGGRLSATNVTDGACFEIRLPQIAGDENS